MKIESINNFIPKSNQTFFLDSNVWLYLLLPQDNTAAKGLIHKYSKLSDELANLDCLIQTNLIQISELINVILHKEYRFYVKKGGSGSFKNFRSSADGKLALSKAKTFIAQITKLAVIQTGLFTNEEMKGMVSQCHIADFNDLYFVEFCVKQNAILITHDFDFGAIRNKNLTIVSANRNYFS